MYRVVIANTNSSRTRWIRDKSFEGWKKFKKYSRQYEHGYATMRAYDAGFIGTIYDENDEVVYSYKTAQGVYEYPEHVQTILDRAAKKLEIF